MILPFSVDNFEGNFHLKLYKTFCKHENLKLRPESNIISHVITPEKNWIECIYILEALASHINLFFL